MKTRTAFAAPALACAALALTLATAARAQMHDPATPPAVAEAGLDAFLAFVTRPHTLTAILAETEAKAKAARVRPPAAKTQTGNNSGTETPAWKKQ